jgi:hypothetical protein
MCATAPWGQPEGRRKTVASKKKATKSPTKSLKKGKRIQPVMNLFAGRKTGGDGSPY